MTLKAFCRQTDLDLHGHLSLADILTTYQAKPAQIVQLEASGQLAGIPRRGGVWFAKDAVERIFQPRR